MEIEPCCFTRQLTELLSEMGKTRPSTVSIYNTGEWTLPQLLPWVAGADGRACIMLTRPTLTEPTIAALAALMGKTVVNWRGQNIPAIRRLEIVTKVDEGILSILSEMLSPYSERVRIAHCEHRTHLLYRSSDRPTMPVMVLGELPERKSHADCTCILSSDPVLCEEAAAPMRGLLRVNAVRKRLISLTS
ncbi:MAG: hypothetical protein IJ767_03845 [Bacteroidaceae bacterium]|nr:hypothetical protein [Bacteroidaceae bacterium]